MIGRLQNELVRVNSQVGELDTELERLKRAEAECERLQKRVADLEIGRGDADSLLSAAKSKARHNPCGMIQLEGAFCRIDWQTRTYLWMCRGAEFLSHECFQLQSRLVSAGDPAMYAGVSS